MLPNGLQIVTEDIRSTGTYSLGVFVSVGSRHETPSKHGASHFLEHLLFKGTATRTAEQISASIESVGGELNAYTAKEHTCFYARVLHSDAEIALDVLSDMITHSLITPDDVDAERAVILDEISMHADDPAELAVDAVAFGHELGAQGGVRRVGHEAEVYPRSSSLTTGSDRRRDRACPPAHNGSPPPPRRPGSHRGPSAPADSARRRRGTARR